MTISTSIDEVQYAGNGTADTFAYTFKITTDADLQVSLINDTTGARTPQTITTHYTVTGAGDNAGGSVVFVAAPDSGYTVDIRRVVAYTQTTDFRNQGSFFPESHEDTFDRQEMQIQQLARRISQSLRVDDFGAAPNMLLAPVETRKGKYLYFNVLTGAPDYAAALTSETLSQSTIGDFLYPISGAESGVTIITSHHPYGDIRRYGAVPDGATSIAIAWGRANTQAAAGGAPIRVPRTPLGFATDATLPVDYRSDLYSELGASITMIGAASVPCIEISDATNDAFGRRYFLPKVIRQTQSTWAETWAEEEAVGVRMRNCSGCEFFFTDIGGFSIGTQSLPAGGHGFQGNNLYYGGNIYNCRVARDWSGQTGGYSNSNSVFGGRNSVFGSVNSGVSRFGDRITSRDASYLTHNCNVFVGGLHELNAAAASAEAVGVICEYAEDNHWIDTRSEGNDLTMRATNSSTRNLFEAGFLSDVTQVADQQDDSTENLVVGMRSRVSQFFDYPVFQLKDAGRKAIGVSNTSVVIPGVIWLDSSQAVRTAASDTLVTYDGNYVTIPASRGMGVIVTTTGVKEMIVRRAGTAGGRVHVIAYDSGDNILSAAGSVVGTPANSLAYSAGSFGGSWGAGGDSLGDVYFRVGANVAYVVVFIAGGTAAAVLSNFEIYAPSGAGIRVATGVYTTPASLTGAYTPTNVTPDRSFDADTVLVAELADVVGTLIADLQQARIID